jgi:CubicO group peptidase (beta-lactamase class C family)
LKNITILFLSILIFPNCFGQIIQLADSIRKSYHIPELGYAVVSSSNILDMQIIGVKKINTSLLAEHNDKFRIGSNTKAITGFTAAQLVKQKRISWDTKFFDLFPELKAKSNRTYHHLTLLNLLTFRTKLFPYTYTYSESKKEQFTGSEGLQRYQFTTWFFKQNQFREKTVFIFLTWGM